MKDLKERAIKATKLFLERRGYEVVETGWECPAGAIDVVAMEDDILVFVEVSARTADEGGFPEGSGLEGRGRREMAAIAYLAEHEDVDRPVRFDDVSLVVFGEGKAFLRHHINPSPTRLPLPEARFPRRSPKTSWPLRGAPRPSGRGFNDNGSELFRRKRRRAMLG